MAASTSSSILRRALLYVPSSSQKMLTKSLSLTCDNITYDLEDAVAPSKKQEARESLRSHLLYQARPASIGELAVRINAISTPHALDDLLAMADLPRVDTIVIPKVNSASDLSFVTDVLRQTAPERYSSSSSSATVGQPIKLIALVETARSVMDLRSICASSPYLNGLIFAAEDFALDLSLTRTPSLKEFLYARSAVATAARAFNLPSTIDLVCTSYQGDEGLKRLEEECQNGKEMGFNGKQCIHPGQVDIVQRMFGPSEAEVEWAVRVTISDDKAAKAGRGAWTFQGKMIDAPVSGKARAIVAKAEKCGFDIQAMLEKWKNEEPE
ncbi:Pyruvate/Phosphoenolpyruvate kinase-like domain-containing protein [Apodospora peruviana]|uniref:Pyruvate/Phosphoenolpyruvate kinase-like domain-containing protein n=1 Tax=Apodospora peruviana TaxID=516989 RepID=A0AAE0MF98_9PEZI|nr:Pyruvate/Phosphoenolpyruvate kinase-like domain-containing protein [Apodospora peruviana]